MKTKKHIPPKSAQRFLNWFLRNDFAEEVQGDLDEQFYSCLDKTSLFKSKLIYWYQVLNYLRPFAIGISTSSHLIHYAMFRHNFLLTFRNFNRYKSSFIINLTGLSTGLACSLFIYLWVSDELSFDKFHENDQQLYQVMLHHEESGTLNTQPDTQALLAKALEEEVPEVELAVEDTPSDWFADTFTLSDGKTNFKSRGKFSGSAYFKMFSFPLIIGNSNKVLSDKKSIVISETLARKLFETPDQAVGKFINWNLIQFNGSAVVTGVFKDLPDNSTDQFDFVLPYSVFADLMGKNSIHWGNYNAYTHVMLREGTDVVALNAKIENFVKEKKKSSNVTVFVRPFSDRHLYDKYEAGVQSGGRIENVRLLSIVALFILFIACINFMNLSTARASRRVKELGVKKAIGASRKALIVQYLSESTLLVFLSLIVSILMVVVLMPQFNSISGKNLSLPFDMKWILIILGITLITGIFSGTYPALYLSGFNPINVLKGKLNSTVGELWARKGLVVFQFTLSIILIVSVMVVYFQIDYMQTTNLGYERENVIIFPREGTATEHLDVFLTKLKELPGVVNCAASGHSFTESEGFTTGVKWEGKDPDVSVRFANATIYYDVFKTLGLDIKAGRGFSRDFTDEASNIIFNERAIEEMGLTDDDPVGKTVNLWGKDKTIIGVVNDFHFQSLHEEVQPMFFRFDVNFSQNILLKIESGKERETLADIASFYKSFNPTYTFDFKFMDQKYQAQYVAEQRLAQLSRYFAGIAILISCLGLFGLAAFTAERRLKEVGIRKILGSGNLSIVYMLSKDFTRMVIAAIVLAIPISYFFTKNWLNGFAYRIELQWWFFVGAGFITLIIALFTVGLQTIKAAGINPTECLKDE